MRPLGGRGADPTSVPHFRVPEALVDRSCSGHTPGLSFPDQTPASTDRRAGALRGPLFFSLPGDGARARPAPSRAANTSREARAGAARTRSGDAREGGGVGLSVT